MEEGNSGSKQLQFVSAVGHDLKTPLVFIKGAAGQLKSNYLPTNDSIRRLNQIEQSADRLLKLIDSAIAASQANADQTKLSLEPAEAGDLVAEAVSGIYPYARQLGYDFDVKVSHYLPPVLTHKPSVQRVLFNLLDNAVKYTRGRRDIQVRARRDGRDHVRISIRDWGVGVSKTDIDQIFKLFGRVSQGSAQSSAGSGLGLYIAADFSRRLSAELSVKSLSKGSSFFVRLPIAKQLSLFA